MSYDEDKLYKLLPAIYRIRDDDRKELRALISVLAEQTHLIEEDIDQLYNNCFIETCNEWIVPYIGDLLGVRNLHQFNYKGAFSQRARIANTIGYRRRKGTAAMLEQLAHDSTGWNARVVEFFKLLGTTQHLNHIRLENYRTPDIRNPGKMELLDTPFDIIAHTCDVRRIESRRGRHNIHNVGIFLWRLEAYPVKNAKAYSHGNGHFSFSQLGNDIQLFNYPELEEDPGHLAEETNVPAPIRRLAFHASAGSYYGKEEKSLYIRVKKTKNGQYEDIENIVPCNLERWEHVPANGKVAVDPVLGRILFPETEIPVDVEVCYYYGFSGEVGGGLYERRTVDQEKKDADTYRTKYEISPSQTINDAINKWSQDDKRNALFIIKDSHNYEVNNLEINIPEGVIIEIRAENGQRPVIETAQHITVLGEKNAQLILDGLLIKCEKIEVKEGKLRYLHIRHCTLVPGLPLEVAGNGELDVIIDRSITGGLYMADSHQLTVRDSLIDGSGSEAISCRQVIIENSTVLGWVTAQLMELASNSIFTGEVKTIQKQEGCIRFCYFPENSEVPRQYKCQPYLTIEKISEVKIKKALSEADPNLTPENKENLKRALREETEKEVMVWLKPSFTSIHYGDPGYAQLHLQCPIEIRAGADDEAEMGVFNHLKQPQREANLLASLEEYMRFGLEAGIFYVT